MTSRSIEKFPKDPVLVKLLQSASAKSTTERIIYDASGFHKTYAELLADVVQARGALQAGLPPSALGAQGLVHEENPYICALTSGGYEFIVAFFAIRAMGGACLPLASGILPEEAYHYISLAKATTILMGASHIEHASKISEYAKQQEGSALITLPISTNASPLASVDIGIDESLNLPSNGPGIVMFTSGTTGIPKAAVLPRQCLVANRGVPGGVALSYRPPHWRGGFNSHISPPMLGMKVHILRQKAPAEDVWEALKNHRITNLIFNPTLLRQMMNIYNERLIHLPAEEQKLYLDGFKNLGKIKCSGAILAPTILKFWTDLTGLPHVNGYGSTECGGGVMEVDFRNPPSDPRSVGVISKEPPVDVKLSEGDYGEILVKSPWMLTKYIGNEKATREAFDEEGYLRTGDLGHVINGEYFFDGRARDDFIKRIPRIMVEEALTNLPYVDEAYIVAVPDHENRAVCGALIRVKRGTVPREEVSIIRLHEDLTGTLPAYMRPYLLRVLKDDEEVPYTASQKPIKREILTKFFGIKDFWDVENPTPGVEVWANRMSLALPHQIAELKPWDWAGWQMSG